MTHSIVAILPCSDLDRSEAFYARLGFAKQDGSGEHDAYYRILHDAKGASIHLGLCPRGWVAPDRNPFGVYLYTEDVDGLAREFQSEIIEPNAPEDKPWGMYEFAVNDPEGTLVRVGWPTRMSG